MLTVLFTVVLPLLGAGVETGGFLVDHPYVFSRELQPDTPAWKEACMNAFKSFNPDTGMWRDKHGHYRRCRIVRVK